MAFKSLAAATATGAGTSFVFTGGACSWSVQLIVTGSPDAITVCIEGSMDGGTTWSELTRHHSSLASDWFVMTNTPAVNVRLNLVTLEGGTTPTVTGYIEAVSATGGC